jgi:hypothetical protein
LLSGIVRDGDGKTRVVRIVDGANLDESTAAFERLDSLHVYSLSPRGVMTPENLVEVDLGQNRDALGTSLNSDYAALGRVCLATPPERQAAGGSRRNGGVPPPSGPKKDPNLHEDACPKRTVGETRVKAPTEPQIKKKRKTTIESDSEEEEARHPPKVTTYINDKGEEVTEIEAAPEPLGKRSADNPEAPKAQALPSAEKKGSDGKKPVPGKQKGIMGFFKPKQ